MSPWHAGPIQITVRSPPPARYTQKKRRRVPTSMRRMRLLAIFVVRAVSSFSFSALCPTRFRTSLHLVPSWGDLQYEIGSCDDAPVSIDSVLDRGTPAFSTERPTLFRERHGWCPYSERVWLAVELNGVQYDTVRIDNTGGGRPSYFGGQTPQVRWPDGRQQGESMDLVEEIDERYGPILGMGDTLVQETIRKFSNIFPRRARPSSRAAFLFQGNGEPLWRSTFEETLSATDELLSMTDGPFFCGSKVTAADVAWAPFLERYRYQLPCLHEGLEPSDAENYPSLSNWYNAFDEVPTYACQIKGDASSWRKVLTMAGFGNSGMPPSIVSNMDQIAKQEVESAASCINLEIWNQYAATRPHVAATPQAQAGATIIRNRDAILRDTMKRSTYTDSSLPSNEEGLDAAMRGLAATLLGGNDDVTPPVNALARFLDERMCVPRDMGAMSAASIKLVANGSG